MAEWLMSRLAGRSGVSVGRRSPWAIAAGIVVVALTAQSASSVGHAPPAPTPTFHPVTTQDERRAVDRVAVTIDSTSILPRRVASSGVEGRDPQPQPTAGVVVVAPVTAGLVGPATYYAYHAGQAAAGPRLRAWLGSNWRGRTVTVSFGASEPLPVVLTDWCACGGGRLIDLDARDFALFAPLSRGVIDVAIR